MPFVLKEGDMMQLILFRRRKPHKSGEVQSGYQRRALGFRCLKLAPRGEVQVFLLLRLPAD